METYTLHRKEKPVAKGTLEQIYDVLFTRVDNAWHALASAGWHITKPDGTAHDASYEEKEEQNQRYRKYLTLKRRAQLVEIVQALKWTPSYKVSDDEKAGRYWPDNLLVEAYKDGRTFYLHIGYPDRKKCEVKGVYADKRGGGPSICMTYGKGAHACAKDIERRFLPEFEKEAAKRAKQHAEFEENERQRVRDLETVKGGPLKDDEKASFTVYTTPGGIGYIKSTSPGRVRFDYLDVTPENAKKIIELLSA